jgi:hypothetical protein
MVLGCLVECAVTVEWKEMKFWVLEGMGMVGSCGGGE